MAQNPEAARSDAPPARRASSGPRAEIMHELSGRGLDFAAVAVHAGQSDADPFNLLCHLAFNAPISSRRQRANHVKKKQLAMFDYLKPEAQEILNELLEKYAADGELHSILPDVLKLPPISHHSDVNEIIDKFGGPDQLRTAANHLQSLLYAA